MVAPFQERGTLSRFPSASFCAQLMTVNPPLPPNGATRCFAALARELDSCRLKERRNAERHSPPRKAGTTPRPLRQPLGAA
jgi:hypothetical protein